MRERKMESGEFPAAGLLVRADEPMAFWDGGFSAPMYDRAAMLGLSPLDTVPANEVNTLYNRMELGFPALPADMRETKRPGLPEDTDEEYLTGTLVDPEAEFPICPDCGERHPTAQGLLVFTIVVFR